MGDGIDGILERLLGRSSTNGFVSTQDIIDESTVGDLPLDDVDRLYDALVKRNVIIREDELDLIDDSVANSSGYLTSKAKLDYEHIFRRAVDIDNSLHLYIEELKCIPPPGKGEENELLHHAKLGNTQAKNRLIHMFLKVPVRIALYYHDRYRFPLSDTIQDGNIGLVIAVDRIPIGPKYRFSTYAPWWIRQTILRNNESICDSARVPVHVKDLLYRIADVLYAHNCIECEISGSPVCNSVIEEAASHLGITREVAKYYISLVKPSPRFDSGIEYSSQAFVLSDHSSSAQEMESCLMQRDRRLLIQQSLRRLTDRERFVIHHRFGFSGGREETLEEVGCRLEITRERVRQIEAKAIKRLRHPGVSRKLKYLL